MCNSPICPRLVPLNLALASLFCRRAVSPVDNFSGERAQFSGRRLVASLFVFYSCADTPRLAAAASSTPSALMKCRLQPASLSDSFLRRPGVSGPLTPSFIGCRLTGFSNYRRRARCFGRFFSLPLRSGIWLSLSSPPPPFFSFSP